LRGEEVDEEEELVFCDELLDRCSAAIIVGRTINVLNGIIIANANTMIVTKKYRFLIALTCA
jgi:hypothetical protein